jgi:hypothetical protein
VESLVIAVAIIVSPAMYGGPLALVLSFWKSHRIGHKRRILIYFLSTTAIISGTFLVIQNISRGATIIGLAGLITAISAIVRIRKLK